jgi:hypothetical protein
MTIRFVLVLLFGGDSEGRSLEAASEVAQGFNPGACYWASWARGVTRYVLAHSRLPILTSH